jgi:hypothetical protein
MTTDQGDWSRDTLFEVLSNSRRRYILSRVRVADGPVELSEIAREIGAREHQVSPAALDQTDKKRVYVSLYQTHLPKLESVGLVAYDEDSKSVSVTDRTGEIDRVLGTVPPAYRWYRVNGALSVLSGTVLTGSAFDISVLATLPPLEAGLGVVTAIIGATILQALDWTRRADARPPELRDE